MRRVLVLAAMIVLAAAATAAPPTPAELVRFVPADASVVLAVDGAALRGHPTVQQWLVDHQAPWSGVDDESAKFLRDAGLDPTRDIDTMLVAVSFRNGHEEALALFGGRFDPAAIGAALVAHGGTPGGTPNASTYRFHDEQHGHSGAAMLVWPKNDVVIIGTEAVVTATAAGPIGTNAMLEQELANHHVDPRAHFWMVTAPPEPQRTQATDTVGQSGPMRDVWLASRTVKRVAMDATLGTALEFHGYALTDTAENAELLRDAVKGALAAMRLQAQQEAPELVEVLRAVDVRFDGNQLTVSGEVPVPLLESILAKRGVPCP